MSDYDVILIGGGPAGLAAAIEAKKSGAERVLVLERDRELGGILQQCIHNGFGLRVFKTELTGPEYAERFIRQLTDMGIEYRLNTMVMELRADKSLTAMSASHGLQELRARAVVLAMGCRERPRGALAIPGTRPSGVFTAGSAQRYVNMEGFSIGKNIVILGSGDIGLIMARRMTLEGARVHAVAEILPHSNGLMRNIVQCLDDYDIPLLLSHTVTEIRGSDRIEAVIISQVDETLRPIAGTEREYPCDALLLSVGLLPENELSRKAGITIDPKTNGPCVNESMETSVDGIFACGNVAHVHDLVDYVSEESYRAGKHAALCAAGKQSRSTEMPLQTMPGNGVSYIVPQRVRPASVETRLELFYRVQSVRRDADFALYADGVEVHSFRKKIALPGEMQHISVDAGLIQNKGYKTLSIGAR